MGAAMKKLVAVSVLAAFSFQCSPVLVAPPAAPAQTLPDVRDVAGAPVAERVPVVLDVVDGSVAAYRTVAKRDDHFDTTVNVSTRVYDSHGHYDHTETKSSTYTTYVSDYDLEPLCVTPCVAWLPKGSSEVRLTPLHPMTRDGRDLQEATVSVTATAPLAVRASLPGEHVIDHGVLGVSFIVLGAMGLAGGAVAAPFALTRDPSYGDRDAWLTGGLVSLGVGAGLVLVGTILALATRGSRQNQSVTRWLVP
jgi:hypothetical protein